MKKVLLFAFVVILTACSAQPTQSQATTTSTVTVTLPPPTATVIPTPTVAPEFLAIQTQVATAEIYTIIGNGSIEGPKPDGTIGPIEGIKLNPDGKGYTIMVNGAPVVMDADKVSITDAGISIDGYTFDAATGSFTEGFSLESWVGTDEVRMEFAANMKEWNVDPSTITCIDDMCYDKEGKLIFENGNYDLNFLQDVLVPAGHRAAG